MQEPLALRSEPRRPAERRLRPASSAASIARRCAEVRPFCPSRWTTSQVTAPSRAMAAIPTTVATTSHVERSPIHATALIPASP